MKIKLNLNIKDIIEIIEPIDLQTYSELIDLCTDYKE